MKSVTIFSSTYKYPWLNIKFYYTFIRYFWTLKTLNNFNIFNILAILNNLNNLGVLYIGFFTVYASSYEILH